MGRKKARRYTSKAQVGWAFANGMPFAKKWAHRGIRDHGRKVWKRQLPKHSKGRRVKR